MIVAFCRQLAVVVILVAVFLAPLISAADSLDIAMMKETCACHLLQDDFCHQDNQEHDEIPCDSTDDCCNEECHESAEPPFKNAMIAAGSAVNRITPYSTQIPPKVYLSIFVPPES